MGQIALFLSFPYQSVPTLSPSHNEHVKCLVMLHAMHIYLCNPVSSVTHWWALSISVGGTLSTASARKMFYHRAVPSVQGLWDKALLCILGWLLTGALPVSAGYVRVTRYVSSCQADMMTDFFLITVCAWFGEHGCLCALLVVKYNFVE